jgi:hypothetical protein
MDPPSVAVFVEPFQQPWPTAEERLMGDFNKRFGSLPTGNEKPHLSAREKRNDALNRVPVA